jgi:hypothetical protein
MFDDLGLKWLATISSSPADLHILDGIAELHEQDNV